MNELKSKRSYASKHFEKDDKLVMAAHIGHIHYFDKLDSNRFREIDWTLNWDEVKRGWGFKFHSFNPFIPEYADEWVEFRDLYDDKDQTIRYKAQCEHIKGRLVKGDEKISNCNYVIYDNAFGEGIDYILYFTRSQLVKAVRIREKKSEDMTFDFEVDFPKKVFRGEKDNIKYELDVNKGKKFDTPKMTMVGEDNNQGKEWFTYLKGFKVWDSEKVETIEVEFYTKGNKKYLRKIVPKDFLDNSVGDVFTDTTTSYYAGAGDGEAFQTGALSWDNLHDGAGSNSDYTSTYGQIFVGNAGATNYMARGFFPCDTSALPDAAVISAAKFYIALQSGQPATGSYANAWMAIVGPTTQNSVSAVQNDDFVDCGDVDSPTQLSDQVAYSTFVGNAYHAFTLNASGRAIISVDGTTKLGLRDGNDILDNDPTLGGGAWNEFWPDMSEQTGTDNDPYLEVTYTEFTGPAGVKTLQGLAIASVKTIQQTAIASVKTLNDSAA